MANSSAIRVGLADLINHLGPETVAGFLTPFSIDDEARIDEYVRREHGGSHALALGVTDPALAAEIDALFARQPEVKA